jgi:CheY-like chemotaxis protein
MKSVLVIDDDVFICKLVAACLSSLRVALAHSGAEGVAMAAKLHPDLILLDINLPDFSGYEVMVKLRKAVDTEHIPIILLSGEDEPSFDQETSPVWGVLPKPIHPGTFAHDFQKLLNRREEKQ